MTETLTAAMAAVQHVRSSADGNVITGMPKFLAHACELQHRRVVTRCDPKMKNATMGT